MCTHTHLSRAQGPESDGYGLLELQTNTSLAYIRRSNARAAAIGAKMTRLVSQIDVTAAPTAHANFAVDVPSTFELSDDGVQFVRDGPSMLRGLVQATNKSVLFLKTVGLFRQAYLLNTSLAHYLNHTNHHEPNQVEGGRYEAASGTPGNSQPPSAAAPVESATCQSVCSEAKAVLQENLRVLGQWREWWSVVSLIAPCSTYIRSAHFGTL